MINIEIFDELMKIEDIIYFYHVTNKSGDDFISDGLYMIDKELYKTMIELPNEFKNNPIEESLKECGEKGTYRESANIIIIGVDKYEINDFVFTTDYIPKNWTHDFPPNYYIPNNYIAGYIDTTKREFVLNEDFEYNNSLSL